MRSFRYTFFGFLLFFVTVAFNMTLGIIVYESIEQTNFSTALVISLVTFISALFCTIIDYFRRKIMIGRPLKEILNATELMARGNFKVRLIPHNSYKNYDEFDYIKEDLNNLAKELSKSEVLKTDFIANLSHEIKTPLSIIQNYAKALENKDLDLATKEKYLNNLQEGCKRLTNLVTNILKLNKLENQKLTPEISNFNLSESLIKELLQYEDIIDNKNLNLECDIEEDLYINSEESYLKIIWNNLISNAIKFTDNGGIIKISLKKINSEYEFKISDSGCGMDKETGIHIFDKFYQGDTSHSKEGNGLGLTLVKKVIDVLGGSINVESEKGKGTTFTVTIMEE